MDNICKIKKKKKPKMAEIQDDGYTYGGIQTYRGQHMGASEHTRASKHWGHPTYREVSKHMGAFKHTGGIQTYRGCIQTYGGI